MKVYKVVPCADSIVVTKKQSAQDAIVKFYDILKQECVDGWEFHSMSPVAVTKKLGKFKNKKETYHAFVFVKETSN